MSLASERINYILEAGIHPLLKRVGFRKSSHTFRRPSTACIQIVNVQGSRWNSGDEGRFTINLAVYFPEAVRIDGSFQITDLPQESHCMVRERIGWLMPIRQDYWWDFDSKSDLDEIALNVSSACKTYGLPWLDKHATTEGAIEFALSKERPYWASIFSLLLDDRESAKKYLSEAITKAANNPGFQSRLAVWGHANGLIN